MSGEKSDISHFCEQEWFKEIMFCDETATCPDDVMKLGYYHEPTTDIGSATTTMILTQNEQVCIDQQIHCGPQSRQQTKMGPMLDNSSWPESIKGWGPRFYPESWKTWARHYSTV